MLKGINFDSMDMDSAFTGAIADRSCGNVRSVLVVKPFTQYRDLLKTIHRQGLRVGLTETESGSLDKSINYSQDHDRSGFERYQVSGMRTSK